MLERFQPDQMSDDEIQEKHEETTVNLARILIDTDSSTIGLKETLKDLLQSVSVINQDGIILASVVKTRAYELLQLGNVFELTENIHFIENYESVKKDVVNTSIEKIIWDLYIFLHAFTYTQQVDCLRTSRLFFQEQVDYDALCNELDKIDLKALIRKRMFLLMSGYRVKGCEYV